MKITGTHEDRIYEVKKFVTELSKVQDRYFAELVQELNLSEKAEEYLFDYIFNESDSEDFESYLMKYTKEDFSVFRK